MASHFYSIPDFIARCPFPPRMNPHYATQSQISYDWLDSFGVHSDDRHRQGFQAMDFAKLTARCYPEAEVARFRVLCDYINALFAFDDLTDEGVLRKDGDGALIASNIVMDALNNPETFETTFRVGQVFYSFWGRAIKLGASAGTQRRYIGYTDLYLRAVNQQVILRAERCMLNIDDFVALRRDTGALKMCFAMGEFSLGLNIPDEVFENPLVKVMEDAANDVVVLSNDVYSYNIEQAQGETMNIIETAMRNNAYTLQEAMDYAGDLVISRMVLFEETKKHLPS